MAVRDRIEQLEQELSRLRLELSLYRKSEEKYRSIFERLPVSIQVVDEHGIITEVNPYHVTQVGKGKTRNTDYLGHYVVSRASIVQAGLSEKYQSVLDGGEIDEREVYFPCTTGGCDAYHNVKGVPIKRDGKILGAIFITEDVTALIKTQEKLRAQHEQLEELVAARTRDLQQAYQNLRQENSERRKAEREKEQLIAELREALAQVKTLSGFIPICSSCKKIRDDQGFWNQVEIYIMKHSEAEFSHGICPECAERLYPDFCKN